MAQLPDDQLHLYQVNNNANNDQKNNSNDNNADNNEKKTEFFKCSDCNNPHEVSDVFLWSTCSHKYGRNCVIFYLKQQLYNNLIPSCGICNELLLDSEASLILSQEEYNQFINIINDNGSSPMPPLIAVDNYNDDNDIKQNNNLLNDINNINNNNNGYQSINQLSFNIDNNPSDNSSNDSGYHDKNIADIDETMPLLYNAMPLGNNNHNDGPILSFQCVSCNSNHSINTKFEWSICRHLYSQECAENIIISSLFEQNIAKCVKCKQNLLTNQAAQLLPQNEYIMYQKIVNIKHSIKQLKQSNDNKEKIINKNNDDNKSPVLPINDKNIKNDKSDKPDKSGKSVNGPDNSDVKTDNSDIKPEKSKNQNDKYDNSGPSILMLPNDFKTLLPIDDDFDANGVLTSSKKHELKQENLFYCVKCKELKQLFDNKTANRIIFIKCEHEVCKKCAKQHTLHEIEVIKKIPTCNVCGKNINDMDMVNIWGKIECKKLSDILFKHTSLKIPPFRPTIDGPQSKTNPIPDDNDINPDNSGNNDVVLKLDNDHSDDNNKKQNDVNDKKKDDVKKDNDSDDDNDNDKVFGYCLTPDCDKKYVLPDADWTRVDCVDGCGISWCTRCGVEFHLGQTCNEFQQENYNYNQQMVQMQNYPLQNNYQIMDKNELAFQELLMKEGWKTCPQCLSVIEKAVGCNYMTCNCGAHFCYLCEQIVKDVDTHYNDDNHPYHANDNDNDNSDNDHLK